MLPQFLLPETVVRADGAGPEIALASAGVPLLLTLGINRIVEQQSLDLSVWGSADGQTWTQLASFPQKFYCGTYALVLDLKSHSDVSSLRVQWKLSRWGRGDLTPLFGMYVFAEPLKMAATAG
jgi:hypothetical protein